MGAWISGNLDYGFGYKQVKLTGLHVKFWARIFKLGQVFLRGTDNRLLDRFLYDFNIQILFFADLSDESFKFCGVH